MIADFLMWVTCLVFGHGPAIQCRDLDTGREYRVCLLCNRELKP